MSDPLANAVEEEVDPLAGAVEDPLEGATEDTEATPAPVASPAPAQTAPQQPTPDPTAIDLNKPQAPQLKVADTRFAPVTQDSLFKEQMSASLQEDARRVKKFTTETVPGAAKAAWDAQAEVGNFLVDTADQGWEIPGQFTAPYENPNHPARQLDSLLQRDPLSFLQAVGHGVAPQTVSAPGAAPSEPGLITQLSAFKDAAMSPAVSTIKSAQKNIGAPLVDLALTRVGDKLPPEQEDALAAQEMMLRDAAHLIGGEHSAPNPDDPKYLKAINRYGETPLIIGETVAYMAGEAPFFLFSTGMGSKAVAAEKEAVMAGAKLTQPLATKAALKPILAKEATIEAAAQAGIQTALTPGQDIVTGPVTMTIFGGMAGHGMSGKMAEAMTMASHPNAALMPPQTWDKFLAEIDDLVSRTSAVKRVGPKREGGGYGKAGAHTSVERIAMDVASGSVRPGPNVKVKGTSKGAPVGPATAEIEPSWVTVARNSDGVLVGREVEAKLDGTTVELAFRDTPIRTPKDATTWQKRVGKVYKGEGAASADNWKEFNVLAGMDASEKVDNWGFGTTGYEGPEMLLYHPNPKVSGAAKRGAPEAFKDALRGQRAAEIAARDAALTPEQKMASAASTAPQRPVVATVGKDKRVRVTPVNDPPAKPTGAWKLAPGDMVMDADNTALVVQGFTPNGMVLAKKVGARGGRPRTVPNESLKFVADKDGLTGTAYMPDRAPAIGVADASVEPLDTKLVNDITDQLKVVTVSRLTKLLHTNPGTAAMEIERMLADGRLYKTSVPGVYTVINKSSVAKSLEEVGKLRYEPWGELPVDPYQHRGVEYFKRAEGPAKLPPAKLPGMDDPVQWGSEVWFGKTRRGSPMKGVIRGPDPQKPGHYLLDVYSHRLLERMEAADALQKFVGPDGTVVQGIGGKNLHTVSVPLAKLRTTIPVNYAKPALTKLFANKGLYGLTTPHPPNFVVASSTFQKQVNNAVALAQANRMPLGLAKAKDKLEGQLLNAYYRTPVPLRRKAAQLYAAWPAARDSMLRIAERVKDATGGYANQADRDLIAAMEQAHATGDSDAALKDWLAKNPRALDSMRTLRNLLDERKANSQWLADRGLSSIDMLELARGAGEEPEYLTMMYNVDVLKGKYDQWVKKNAPKLWDDAVAELTRGGRNPAQVESELAHIMRQENPVEALSQSTLVDNSAFKKLMARGQWQQKYPGIAKLMGPVPSASLRLGHTIGYQRAIKANLSAWDAIADSGWWSWGPREDLTLRIPDDPRFGKAAGGYTHESLRNFVEKKPEDAANEFASMLGWMGGKWKSFHTVYGGPAPWVNNTLRNLKGVVISGALETPDDFEGFKRAPGLLLAWRENPSMLGPAAIVGEAKQFSALSAGFAGAEIHDAKNRIQDELLRAMSRAAGTASRMEDMVMAAQDFMRNRSENVKDAYDAIDQFFKLATYINRRKKYIAQGMSIHDASATAAEDVMAAYPNFELTAPLVERNRGKFGWVAPFISSKAEDARINAMTMARIARGDPGLTLRLAAFGTTVAGGIGLMRSLARANGITAQDEQDGKNLLTMKQQSWSPALVPMWDLDDQGRMQFMDLTPMDDLLMMLRGNPNDPVLARLFLNNTLDVLGDESYSGRAVHGLMNSAGLVSSSPEEMKVLKFGEAGVLGVLGDYARSGGVPQAVYRAADNYERTQPQPNNPTWEQWSPTQALVRGVGLPYAGPVGMPTMVRSLKEAKGEVRKLKSEAKQIPRRIGEDPQRFDYLLQSKVRGIGATQDRINQIKPPKEKDK